MSARRERETGIIEDKRGLLMICQVCGRTWSPNIQSGGRMPKGWRECPEGCTRDPITKIYW